MPDFEFPGAGEHSPGPSHSGKKGMNMKWFYIIGAGVVVLLVVYEHFKNASTGTTTPDAAIAAAADPNAVDPSAGTADLQSQYQAMSDQMNTAIQNLQQQDQTQIQTAIQQAQTQLSSDVQSQVQDNVSGMSNDLQKNILSTVQTQLQATTNSWQNNLTLDNSHLSGQIADLSKSVSSLQKASTPSKPSTPVKTVAKPTPKPSTPTPAKPTTISYTVKKGETLSGITDKVLGSGSKATYSAVAKANGISNPDKIKAGQVIKITVPPKKR